MDHFYAWKEEYFAPSVAVTCVSVGFAAYWFISASEKIRERFFLKYSPDRAWIMFIFFQKMMGVLFMGVIPGIIVLGTTDYTLPGLGLKFGNFKESLTYIGVMGLLIVLINFFASRNQSNLKLYPQMRIMEWDVKRIAANSFAWGAYLLAYEFMFRGILLVVCYDSFGFWPAVAINLSLYSATHIPKGLGETIGTFPYGLLLCYITISTGSIAVAFISHLILALSNDYFSVYHSPEMKFFGGSFIRQKRTFSDNR